jgi:hypothetical protein
MVPGGELDFLLEKQGINGRICADYGSNDVSLNFQTAYVDSIKQ